MTTLGRTVSRALDHLERRLWETQDERLRNAGWEVTRLGRWRRSYRLPAARFLRSAGEPVRTANTPAEPVRTPRGHDPLATPLVLAGPTGGGR